MDTMTKGQGIRLRLLCECHHVVVVVGRVTPLLPEREVIHALCHRAYDPNRMFLPALATGIMGKLQTKRVKLRKVHRSRCPGHTRRPYVAHERPYQSCEGSPDVLYYSPWKPHLSVGYNEFFACNDLSASI